jgi:hypothetical protein
MIKHVIFYDIYARQAFGPASTLYAKLVALFFAGGCSWIFFICCWGLGFLACLGDL